MSLAAYSPAGEDQLRTDCYRVLARLFAAPPDLSLLQHLRQSATGADDELGRQWNALCAASVEEPARLADEYGDLFLAVGAAKVFPYGSWYLDGSLMGRSLVRLRSDLARLGLARKGEVKEPEDHMAAVLEVMGLLVEGGSGAQAEFFDRHLAPWYEAFCDAVEAQAEGTFYRAAAGFARRFLAVEAEMLKQW
ncbi:MAG TPA: molecular chaperone TorD family protein [Rhodocyclaceae bacterium]|nr:molecular chaperone TorD family protein [Rhodocyclaceae bacterium]